MSELIQTIEINSQDNEFNTANSNYFLASSHEEMNSRRRNTMEDSHRIHSTLSPLYNNILASSNNVKSKEQDAYFNNISFFSIYDGHGGRQIVDFLETNLEKNVVTELAMQDDASYDEKITRSFLISDMESKKLNHLTSGATGIMALIRANPLNPSEKELLVANIGDSRGVLITNTIKEDAHTATLSSLVASPNDTTSSTFAAQELEFLKYNNEHNLQNYNKYILKISDDSDDDQSQVTVDSLTSLNSEDEDEKTPEPSGYYGYRLSYDHKASDALEQERVKHLGGFFSKSRLLGILAITRSFGDHSMKEYVISRPFISRTPLNLVQNRGKLITTPEGEEAERLAASVRASSSTSSLDIKEDEDIGIILGCDGIWDVFTDQEATDYVMAKYRKYGPYKDAAKDLVNAAIARGSTDNITAIVIFF